MMHTFDTGVALTAPTNLAVTLEGSRATLTWNDDSLNETGFVVQRS